MYKFWSIFNSFEYISAVKLLCYKDNFLKNHKTLFHSNFTILLIHSHQQCMRLPISLSLCQHLLLSVFIFGMLESMTWCLAVLLIWSSLIMTSLVAQTVKRLSIMWETRVRALGWGDPLEKEMAIHSSTIAWRIPWTEEPGRLQSMGSQRVEHDWATSVQFSYHNQGLFLILH